MTPPVEQYVLHWGEMGTRWGTNRTVAQIQALLYLSPEPLRADQICDLLSDIHAKANVTVLHITHSLREAERLGTCLLELKGGEVRPR